MAKSAIRVRRQELVELVHVAHGEPNSLIESLKNIESKPNDGWKNLAIFMQDGEALERMQTRELTNRVLGITK